MSNDGNNDIDGWMQYQRLVLEQLEEHKEVLKNITADNVARDKGYAIDHALSEHWRGATDNKIEEIKKEIRFINEDEKGVNVRLKSLEDSHKVEERSKIQFKAWWGFIGGGIIVLIDLGFKFWGAIFHP